MPTESISKLEERLDALYQRVDREKDPELIRAFSKDIIALETKIQKKQHKQNPVKK
tara:strand:+ start:434 stop:601 length:168 start_codon:yes stop_codon:yes gene_type:complete